MRYGRVSDKIEERHRLSNLTRSGYRREKSRYRPEKAKVRNVGIGMAMGKVHGQAKLICISYGWRVFGVVGCSK